LSEDERAFYNKIHWDIELYLESLGGFKEIGGVHYRGDHDLSGHQKISKDSQEVFFDNKKILPHVLELSFGVDRNIYALIELSYKKEKNRVFLSLPFTLAPIQISIFPLVKKDGLDKKAVEIYETLKQCWDVFYDDSGSIGKRYYREDERGTPLAVTIDHDTLKDNAATVRNRDDTKQIRVKIKDLTNIIWKLLNGEIEFEKAGS
jgi:glycyl-tRNA synthetase